MSDESVAVPDGQQYLMHRVADLSELAKQVGKLRIAIFALVVTSVGQDEAMKIAEMIDRDFP